MIDFYAHLDFKEFDRDCKEAVRRSELMNVYGNYIMRLGLAKR